MFNLIFAVSVIVTGLFDTAGMKNSFYVILPYVFSAVCFFVIVWNSFRIVFSGERIKGYVYTSATSRISPAALMYSVFSAVCLIGSVMFFILNGFEGKLPFCIGFILLKIFDIIFGLYFRKFFAKIYWIKL